MPEMSSIQLLIAAAGTVVSIVLGIIKYVDVETKKAKEELRVEIQEIKANQNQTQLELRKITESILEIKVFLFGAFKEPGFLQRLKDEIDEEN